MSRLTKTILLSAILGLGTYIIFLQKQDEVIENDIAAEEATRVAVRNNHDAFPTGRELGVAKNQNHVPRSANALENQIEVPSGRAVDVVARLLPLASSGDSTAAYQIALKLRQCRSAMGSLPNAEIMDRYQKAGISSASVLSQIENTLNECIGITKEQLSDEGKWLEMAADKGLLEAQLLYSADPEPVVGNASDMIRDPGAVQRYKNKALGYLQQLAANGNINAIQRLSSVYADGILVKQDKVLAYAYAAAAERAMPAPQELQSEHFLESMKQQIPVDQQEYADQAANKIYVKCCGQ
jgi:TPR repeat protein